ncbi:MAG: hypothetical protein ACXWBM_05310 [Chthoniobacterales bacterium]
MPTPPAGSAGWLAFDQFKPGAVPAGLLAMHGGQIVAEQGVAQIAAAGPEMVLPLGHKKVFLVQGDRTTAIRFVFDPPITKFTLTRIGVINNASVPSWQLVALDSSGNIVDVVGELHGLYPKPHSYSVKGERIASVRLTSDNRYGSGTWATYNSLPVAQFQIERGAYAAATPPPRPSAPATLPALVAATPKPPPLATATATPPPIAAATAPPPPPPPRPTTKPLPTAAPTAIAAATATPVRATPTATPQVVTLNKKPPPGPGIHGKPEAVIAAAKKGMPASVAGGHEEAIDEGAFIVQRPESWELADTTDNAAMFVSQDLPNCGVTFDWSAGAQDEVREHAGVERLGAAEIGGANAERYAWVETAEPERREALHVSWNLGTAKIAATAVAPTGVWQKNSEKIFALLNVRAGERKPASARKPTPTPTPAEVEVSPTPTPPPTPTPTPTPTPPLTVAASVVQRVRPAQAAGELQTIPIGDGRFNLQHDRSWQVSDSGGSYVVLIDAKSPDLTVSIESSPARGRSLDQLAQQEIQRLRGNFERAQVLVDRKIGGVPAKQLAWFTGTGGEARETLQVEWIAQDTLFRATISAPPELWKKDGPRVLRLLEDFTAGGGSS